MSYNTNKNTRRVRSLYALMVAGLLGATTLTGINVLQPGYAGAAQSQLQLNTAPAAGFADLVENVMPSVVSVRTKAAPVAAVSDDAPGQNQRQFRFGFPEGSPFEHFFRNSPDSKQFRFGNPRKRGGSSQGSGFIISEDGFVVTNNHVVRGAKEVSLTFSDGKTYDAKVIGKDPKTDLALLKIDSDETFKPVKFAKSKPRVGDWVIAVGNPFGLGGTVTTGIVSASGRDIGAGPYDNFLQIDAPINKGNSGGPAFNLNGEVVGINTAIFSPSGGSVGIGFAIPASTAKTILEDLKDDGTVTRGWLGVQIQPVTDDLAESLGMDKAEGSLVAAVTEGSPAEKAGLKAGDAIVMIDDKTVKGPKELSRTVAGISPDKTVDMSVYRNGKVKKISVKIGNMPGEQVASLNSDEPSEAEPAPRLGLALAPTPDNEGVAVADVMPGSSAEKQGLRQGDVILEVNGAGVDQPEAAIAAIKQSARKDETSPVLLLVRTETGQRFVALKFQQS